MRKGILGIVSLLVLALVTPSASADCAGSQLHVTVVQYAAPGRVVPWTGGAIISGFVGSASLGPIEGSGSSYTMTGNWPDGAVMAVSAEYGFNGYGGQPHISTSATSTCSHSAWSPSTVTVCFGCPTPQALRGLVVHTGGAPFATATVKLNNNALGVTDNSGAYQTTLTLPGTFVVEASAPGYVEATSAPFAWNGSPGPAYVTAPPVTVPTLTLVRVGSISGTAVYGAKRTPDGNRLMTLKGNGITRQVVADGKGAFRFGDLPPGRYVVETLYALSTLTQQAEVKEGADTTLVFWVNRPGTM